MNRIEKNSFTSERLDYNIIHVHVKHNADIDVDEIKEVRETNETLADGKPYVVLFEIAEFAFISKEAREYGGENELGELRKAMAIVVKSMAHRILANFFINVNKPPTPTKVFNDKAKALEWLNQFVKKINR